MSHSSVGDIPDMVMRAEEDSVSEKRSIEEQEKHEVKIFRSRQCRTVCLTNAGR